MFQSLGKIIFSIGLALNGLIVFAYWCTTLWSLLFPPNPTYRTAEGLRLLTGFTLMLALMGWSYHLTYIQHKLGPGFAVLVTSYLTWLGLLVVALLFFK